MEWKKTVLEKITVLDVAIYIGLAAVFLAVSVPLIRGAVLRQRTAECARKMMWAADAFDQYALTRGEYPPDGGRAGDIWPCDEMNLTFVQMDIDWWGEATEMGGAWDWFSDRERGYIAIANPKAPERHMERLDRLIDDGNLDAGTFRRYGPVYCYILKQQRRADAGM
jgi:hypothetical protein